MKQVAIFGLVWPKLSFSAASVRTTGLIHSLIKQNVEIHYICPQKIPKDQPDFELDMYDSVRLHQVKSLEDFSEMKKVFDRIKGNLDASIFDTFIAEEKFSHFVHRQYPTSLKVLDLQDMHSLRQQRRELLYGDMDSKPKMEDIQLSEDNILVEKDVLSHKNNLQKDLYGRELASIMRSDMVITCSEYEKFYLEKKYSLKNIELLTFFNPFSELKFKNMKRSFERRRNFAWIGNHSHPPNIDSLYVLTKYIWPKIHQQLPEAQLHIYGSNFNKQIADYQYPGIRPLGLMKDLSRLENYRGLLAPIRFGGGIKGKITDSWQNYLPVVTTPIGAESLYHESIYDESLYTEINTKETYLKEKLTQPTKQNQQNQINARNFYNSYNENQEIQQQNLEKLTFGGFANNYNIDQFVNSAVKLYNEKQTWEEKVEIGIQTNLKKMSFLRNDLLFSLKINQYKLQMEEKRQNNHLYNITWSETLKSTENFAKYLNKKQQMKKFRQK